MKNIKEIPRYANSEIKFILYNFKNIDNLITKRKMDLIDTTMSFTNNSWLKSINNNVRTQENVILEFDNDYEIIKLNKWNKVINEFIHKLQNCKNNIYFLVFKYKYELGLNDDEIIKMLKISLYELKKIDFLMKKYIFKSAIDNKIYRKGVLDVEV